MIEQVVELTPEQRFALVARERVCPDCGSDVEEKLIRDFIPDKDLKETLPEYEVTADTLALHCTRPECAYWATDGRRAETDA